MDTPKYNRRFFLLATTEIVWNDSVHFGCKIGTVSAVLNSDRFPAFLVGIPGTEVSLFRGGEVAERARSPDKRKIEYENRIEFSLIHFVLSFFYPRLPR